MTYYDEFKALGEEDGFEPVADGDEEFDGKGFGDEEESEEY